MKNVNVKDIILKISGEFRKMPDSMLHSYYNLERPDYRYNSYLN